MTNSYSIFLVGGTFSNITNPDGSYGAVSGVFRRVYNALNNYPNFTIKYVNGGKYDVLETLLASTPQYDFVFWWTNVDNALEKMRNVKEIAPRTMLISSKRNDNQKYSFQELIQRCLALPTNCKTERFIGNASLRKLLPQVGRCGKGMPSFRGSDNIIFVSKRNIDKQFIELDNFVPVWLDNNKLMYSGPDKPSVDTPVQVRLYQTLDHINYILHSHCYIKNAPFTATAIPCGAIEEYDEIMKLLSDSQTDTHRNQYVINLIGHGSIIMWHDMQQFHKDIEPTLAYYKRHMPEYMK